MKKLTHPFLVKTRIIVRNGAIYTKKWVYFRGSLPIERRISSSVFLNKQNSKKRYSSFFTFLKDKKVKKREDIFVVSNESNQLKPQLNELILTKSLIDIPTDEERNKFFDLPRFFPPSL